MGQIMLSAEEAATVKADLIAFIHKVATNPSGATPEEITALPEIAKVICWGIHCK